MTRNRKIIIVVMSLIIGLVAAFTIGLYKKQTGIQQEIASQVIRFHILANSDSRQDQRIKLAVKQAMVLIIEEMTGRTETLAETKEILQDESNLEVLREKAQREVLNAGSTDRVSIQYEETHFPVKNYGDYTFPAGRYEALQIKIGEARGHNWWCMLYPSLCFADALHPTLEKGAEKLRKVLSDDAYLWILEKEDVNFTFRWF